MRGRGFGLMGLGKSGKISGVGGMVLDVGRHDLIVVAWKIYSLKSVY